MNRLSQDLIGKRFNRLIVTAFVDGKYQRELLCECACGKIKSFTHYQLKSGKIKSKVAADLWKGYFEKTGCTWPVEIINA